MLVIEGLFYIHIVVQRQWFFGSGTFYYFSSICSILDCMAVSFEWECIPRIIKIWPSGQSRIKAKYPHDPSIPREERTRIPTIGTAQQRIMANAWFCFIFKKIDFNIFFILSYNFFLPLLRDSCRRGVKGSWRCAHEKPLAWLVLNYEICHKFYFEINRAV